MTANRSALPVRSPYPLAVHCAWVAPASTAAMVFATAHAVSSWQWMPRRAPPVRSFTSVTTAVIRLGRQPPLVSHRTLTEAPAAVAALMSATP